MTEETDGLLRSIRHWRERNAAWRREGEPSVAHHLAHIGVLGWTIVLPTLVGVFVGRWIDHRLGSRIFWTGPLMLLGLVLGCWTAWRWMHHP